MKEHRLLSLVPDQVTVAAVDRAMEMLCTIVHHVVVRQEDGKLKLIQT